MANPNISRKRGGRPDRPSRASRGRTDAAERNEILDGLEGRPNGHPAGFSAKAAGHSTTAAVEDRRGFMEDWDQIPQYADYGRVELAPTPLGKQPNARPDDSLTAKYLLRVRRRDVEVIDLKTGKFARSGSLQAKLTGGRKLEGSDTRVVWRADSTLLQRGNPFAMPAQGTIRRQASKSGEVTPDPDGRRRGRPNSSLQD